MVVLLSIFRKLCLLASLLVFLLIVLIDFLLIFDENHFETILFVNYWLICHIWIPFFNLFGLRIVQVFFAPDHFLSLFWSLQLLTLLLISVFH